MQGAQGCGGEGLCYGRAGRGEVVAVCVARLVAASRAGAASHRAVRVQPSAAGEGGLSCLWPAYRPGKTESGRRMSGARRKDVRIRKGGVAREYRTR